jgi:hypothetical protein
MRLTDGGGGECDACEAAADLRPNTHEQCNNLWREGERTALSGNMGRDSSMMTFPRRRTLTLVNSRVASGGIRRATRTQCRPFFISLRTRCRSTASLVSGGRCKQTADAPFFAFRCSFWSADEADSTRRCSSSSPVSPSVSLHSLKPRWDGSGEMEAEAEGSWRLGPQAKE